MSGTVERYAGPLGWNLARNNVIIEGTSDVAYLTCGPIGRTMQTRRPLRAISRVKFISSLCLPAQSL